MTNTTIIYSIEDSLDSMWILMSGFLVFFMQTGFAMLEVGSVRSRSAQNILLKNIVDVSLGTLLWWLLGYGFAYGKSVGGFIAQELAEAFPSAVTGEDGAMEDILDEDGNKTGERIKPMGVSRENLVPVLIKAVQELSETIESQQKEIEELKNK